MNKIFKKIYYVLPILLLSFIFAFSVNAKKVPQNTNTDILTIIDSDSELGLPDGFRIIKDLNISGSAQFTPPQLNNIKNKINSQDLYIVDLRQESHGFINNIAISFYSPYKTLNKGFNSNETFKKETSQLNNIKKDSLINLYNKKGDTIKKITVTNVHSEEDLTKILNLKYIRFAVGDGHVPTQEAVDDFVEFILNNAENSFLHFHCKHGKGRTTTFMAMYNIMNNKENISLDKILENQFNAGGINLSQSQRHYKFLQGFYNYIKDNKSTNYKTSYSKWIKSISK
ncbi:fused DSP-PTPase phosphatase/NAD kinase-like protein [Clostridium rectalis]|uniref:fused DSP-PTPase phosphatase/NAD kinase-like protein n=1 Tax=Clostridium rectalis TaxID=2040295 RepID=UPI000F6321DE|nr:phosphatase [Clostridium rectalis]